MADDFIKDPDAVLDWTWDWQNWLADGETISASSWIITAGLTKNSESATSTNTKVWLSGGQSGRPYRVTNRITTNLGRTDDRSVTIRITDR